MEEHNPPTILPKPSSPTFSGFSAAPAPLLPIISRGPPFLPNDKVRVLLRSKMNSPLFLLLCASLSAQSLPLIIERDLETNSRKLTPEGNSPPELNHLLHFSHDAQTWFPIANSRTLPWQYLDPDSSAPSWGFYRATHTPSLQFFHIPLGRLLSRLPMIPFAPTPTLPGLAHFPKFLFEPLLEEDISQSTLDELEARDMKQFYLESGGRTPTIKVVGFDNQVRDPN